MKTPTGMVLWAMVGALAGTIVWGAGPARADDAATKASQPYIAPIVPTFEKNQHTGTIGTGERVRDQGTSLRKDLIKKRTVGEIIDRSKRGDDTEGGWIGHAGKPPATIGTPVDTQPISLSYQTVTDDPPPACPEPSGFALAGIGVASLILYGRPRKR